MKKKSFSSELSKWLEQPGPKTLGTLEEVFGPKSFGVALLLLLIFPALPIPTGGISHIMEAIAVLIALELVGGRRTLWLPRWLRQKSISKQSLSKAMPFIIRRTQWLEKHSRPRLSKLYTYWPFRSFIGLLVVLFTLSAMIALPFSGLDTLPSLGVVLIAASMVLEDFALLLAGVLAGAIGILLIVGSGAAATAFWHHFF